MRRKDREITDIDDIESILISNKTCHVAMIDRNMPYVVPLSYGYEIIGKTLILYFHSAKEGRKIDIMRKNNAVCFAISNEGELVHSETPCSYGYCFSSVIGNGEVVFIDDAEEKCRALSLIFERQTGKNTDVSREQAEIVCVFKIISADFTGKRKPRR